jgi:hypothetical protein
LLVSIVHYQGVAEGLEWACALAGLGGRQRMECDGGFGVHGSCFFDVAFGCMHGFMGLDGYLVGSRESENHHVSQIESAGTVKSRRACDS